MNGILSAAPAPHAVRLLVAASLFGCVQPLLLLAAPDATTTPRSLFVVLGLLGSGSLIGAIIGEDGSDPSDRWRSGGGA